MYLLYESLYGDLLCECDSTNIIGLYKDKEQAIKRAKKLIEEDLQNNYILDEERKDLLKDNYVRLFYNNQENWSDYYEIIIKEIKLQD